MKKSRRAPTVITMIALTCVGAGFIYGVLVGKDEVFPYHLMEEAYNALFPEKDADAEIRANADKTSTLTMTSLLPLRMTVYDWPVEAAPYSRGGGGITALGDRTLGVGKNGEFFTFDPREHIRILGKSINTNVGNLALKDNDPENPELDVLRSFRFMDVAANVIAGEMHIFVIYDYWHIEKECKTVRASRFITKDLDRLRVDGKSVTDQDWQLIFESQPCLPFSYRNTSAFQSPTTGGRLALDDQNNLFLSLGDHNLDGVNNPDIAAQGNEFDYGKIFKIDLESLQAEPYAYGIRNPQGMTIDAQGNLWETEHGPQGGDELNLIKAGANYGWPLTTFGTQYGEWQWRLNKTQGRHEGFESPTYAWIPSIGVSNLVRIKDRPALWRDDLLISALRSGNLYRVRLKETQVLFVETIKVGERIRDMALMADGSIVLWTENRNIVHVIAEPERISNDNSEAYRLTARSVPPQLQKITRSCMSCHSFSQDIFTNSAPPLWGVFGRSISATDYPEYSNALRNKSRKKWNTKSLKAFIRNPQEFAPGSTMPMTRFENEQSLDALVDYLQTLH